MAFCTILTLVGLFKGHRELRFIFVGERCVATFTDFSGKSRNNNGDLIGRYAKYKFIDLDENRCIGCDEVTLGWQPPGNDQINIIYLLGEKKIVNDNTISKLEENGSLVSISILLLGLLGLTASSYMVYWHVKNNRFEAFS